MSSLPREVLEDVLLSLDRWTLDAVQFTDRRFLHLIEERMSELCLREITSASFEAPEKYADGTLSIRIDGPPKREISNAHEDAALLLSEFVQALRSSHVASIALNGLVFTPEHAALVLQTPIVTGSLILHDGNCAKLSPTQFRKVLLHFSPNYVRVDTCDLRADQISDEFVRELIKNRVLSTSFIRTAPVDGGSFCVTDDAIVDFCAQPDVPIGHEGYPLSSELVLYRGSFTKDLFKRLLEASSVSTRTQPLRVTVSPVRLEDEDLQDFAQHLSYRQRGQRGQVRIYDFPGEQHGAVAGMRLQIALSGVSRLEVIRAPRSRYDFYEPDE